MATLYSPRIARIDPGTGVNDPASVRKNVYVLSFLSVCVHDLGTLQKHSGDTQQWKSELLNFVHNVFKVMNLSCGFPLGRVTRSLQSSRSVLAACHVVSVEHVLTSLSSGRPPPLLYTLTTSFHGMNNLTRSHTHTLTDVPIRASGSFSPAEGPCQNRLSILEHILRWFYPHYKIPSPDVNNRHVCDNRSNLTLQNYVNLQNCFNCVLTWELYHHDCPHMTTLHL